MGELHTRLCDELAIEFPIFSVGFGLGAVPELAAAVSNAGGFGVVGTGDFEPSGIPRWNLLAPTVAAVAPVPVLASGGIGDGGGIARAIRLGAQGVSLGTRFVASDEAWVHPEHKRRIVESVAADTVCSELFDAWWPDARHRTLRNKTYDEWVAAGEPPPGQRPGEDTLIGRRFIDDQVQPWPRYAVGLLPPTFEGDLDRAPMLTGESCSDVTEVLPAAEIVRRLVAETETALAAQSR